jgi:TonB-linked SusC/RagA family outer membrane protein
MEKHFLKMKRRMATLCMVVLPFTLMAQSNLVTGTVISEDEGMPGVSVVEKGTTNGTITDLDGKYSIQLKNAAATLVFSMVGMSTQEKSAKAGEVVDIMLKSDEFQLEQIVVTGYTTQKKADLTGAVSVVKMSDVMTVAENNPMKALQGRVAGMTITTDGNPSGAATVRIRGIGTMNDNDPLYVIDGVPTKGGMHELNSNDIESIQVLKDASAASIYGSRAGNGVIIITTKQGVKGKARVNFDTYLTASRYGKVIDMMNTKQYGQALFQARINSGYAPNDNNLGYLFDYGYDANGNPVLNGMSVPKYIDGRDGTNQMLTSDTDWFDEITRTGIAQSYNLSVSNGTEKGNYFFSLGCLDNQGTIKETSFNRISARMNSSYKLLGDIVTIGENFTLNRTSEVQAPGGVLDLAIMSLPVMPVKKADGDWGSVTSGMNDRDNPARVLAANKDNPYNYWRMFGNAYVDIQPIKNLHLKSSFGMDYGNFYQRLLTYSFTGRLGSDLTSSKMQQSHSTKWTWSNTAAYDVSVGKNRMDFLAGMEMNKQDDISFSSEKRGYELETPEYMYPSAGTGESFATGGATGYSLLSYFGKINSVYDNKYLASATVRRDGSSRFGKNNRFATFPAFSVGWRISEEKFMESAKNVLSDLKLRAAWGQTGNQEIDNLANRTILITNYIGDTGAGINSGTAYDIAGADSGLLPSGYQLNQRSNDDIKWETTTQTNIGIDFGLFANSLYGSLEYYIKQTDDILIRPPYLGAIGEGGDQWVNGASMENRGLEFNLGYRGKTAFGLTYDLAGNISGYRNKITKLPESVVNNYGGNGTTDNILGRAVDSYYGYVTDGLFRTQDEVDNYVTQTGKSLGRIRYQNFFDDGVIDEADRTWIGNPHPELEYGLNIYLEWKGIDLSAFFQGLYGNKVINNVKKYTDFWAVTELGMNKGTRLLDAWSENNPTSDIPAIALTDENNEKRFSSYYVEPGSYLKLRNLQIGYTLPVGALRVMPLQKVRFYVSGQNLMTLKSKDFTGLDPENPNLAYPVSTTCTVGLNIAF